MKKKIKMRYWVVIALVVIVLYNGYIVNDISTIPATNQTVEEKPVVIMSYSGGGGGGGSPAKTYSWCYQESANISNQTEIDGDCALNYSGTYEDRLGSFNESFPFNNSYDGDWNTYTLANMDDTVSWNITYIIPIDAVGDSLWQVKANNTLYNFTIPSECWSSMDSLYLQVNLESCSSAWCVNPGEMGDIYFICYDATMDGHDIGLEIPVPKDMAANFTEESMWWKIES